MSMVLSFEYGLPYKKFTWSPEKIVNRKNNILNESEMIYILSQLIRVLTYFSEESIPIGEISLDNLIVNEKGELIFLNSFFVTSFEDNVERIKK